ncbi:MAG TPA: cation:proton antiporter [Candidatus Latescibacteria bacterium]|nr:cation:proton antiporter [Candidatus Latescibacterota bacterium]|tara:strand:+ start:1368 stop:2852 length:1485 start_codon:yes stop_codon:yes gene_type:complete
MLLEHLPILQIVVPLMAAPLCILLRRRERSWAFALVLSWVVFAMSVVMLQRVLTEGTIIYSLGGWPAPWGIEYRVDAVNAFVVFLVSLIGAIVLLYAPRSIFAELPDLRANLFFTAYLLCLTGMLGMAMTGDVFNLFVFLEISSLSSYTLIAMGTDRRALMASYQYLVMGTVGATFYVIGVGLLYMMTGTLNMVDLAVRLQPVLMTNTVLAAFAFLAVGIGMKLALFPLHLWLPNAYAHAPSMVTAFLAATATKVSVYVFVRFFYGIFGAGYTFDQLGLDRFLVPLGLAGIFVASLVAVFQSNVKRMLAYSSIAQVGYMMVGVGLVSVTGLTATLVHLFNHAVMKSALFLAIGCVVLRLGSCELEDLRGIGKRMPVTMAAFVAGGLSLIGVPLTVGFISKWYLVLAALERGWWPVAVLILFGSLIAVAYVWRVVEIAYFHEPTGKTAQATEAPLSMLIPVWILTGSTFTFGINSTFTVDIARRGAEILMAGLAP